MTVGPTISILLVDDHPVVRQGYRRVLENQSDFRVVAEADNAEIGRASCRERV